ncbi:MAG TPA: hypothetical protein DDW84_03515 [Phycisphaerales bacterium]|nr:MAG: hypothetical protein A2Y13_04260 [Planctomycetes bacterium GWC2_45_44]HBG77907.1 hypothetical protein [Phycisphaerales bacterium]HBR19251.1 hypothetical protein [Phycisphaerales bacterium]
MKFHHTLIVFMVFSCVFFASGCSKKELPGYAYYGFYPSSRGDNYKQFRHNILGFSIDIPSNWIFGVNGQPPTAVVFIYPEGIVTDKFSDTYETLEIGNIALNHTDLQNAQQAVMKGMSLKHPDILVTEQPQEVVINSRNSLCWIFKWKSKTGYDVTEYITLVQGDKDIRSLAIRTTKTDFNTMRKAYDEMINTFTIYQTKY